MWRSWKNVCWASIGCWTTIITTVIAQWRSRLNACVRMNGGHFQHKMSLWLLLCFVCFIDTGFCKCDRYKHVQSANIVWNVLLLCLTLSHGMVATQRTCGRKFLLQWLRHSLVKLCTKNYENPSIFVKVTAKNEWHLFLSGHGVYKTWTVEGAANSVIITQIRRVPPLCSSVTD